MNKGPIEILCEECGAVYNANMETTAVLISFIVVLVAEIEHQSSMYKAINGGREDSRVSSAIAHINEILSATEIEDIQMLSARFVSEYSGQLGIVGLLLSCVHALQFGLERPCKSRHAAHASKMICRYIYGYSLHDSYTEELENSWVRDKLYDSLGRLAGESA